MIVLKRVAEKIKGDKKRYAYSNQYVIVEKFDKKIVVLPCQYS